MNGAIPYLLSSLLLSSYVTESKPWLNVEANSEQRQPVYLGANPYEIEVLGVQEQPLVLPQKLKVQAEYIAFELRRILDLAPELEFEAWPVQNDYGERTWAFARYRTNEDQAWQWLETGPELSKEKILEIQRVLPKLILPEALYTSNRRQQKLIFDDVFSLQKQNHDLYVKPIFGNCIWSKVEGEQEEIISAWLPLQEISIKRGVYGVTPEIKYVCHSVSQVARWNGKPISFLIKVSDFNLKWLPTPLSDD
ncbi:MAG: hypothetical protein HY072_05930, partial [Deltaproteobacteria bacterium]|nr:hypothetical protein [Deltaproteobacteria bacterium]